MRAGFPGNHDALPKVLVDAAGGLAALLVKSLTGTQLGLELLRQFDEEGHEVREEPGVGRRLASGVDQVGERYGWMGGSIEGRWPGV